MLPLPPRATLFPYTTLFRSEAALQDIQRTLPAGVSATNVQFRQATFIETSVRNVERVLLEAAVVVALILFIFLDRKSTRLNSSHLGISYAVFCLKKKK